MLKKISSRGLFDLPGFQIFLIFNALFILLLFIPSFRSMLTISNFISAASINAVLVLGVTLLMISGEFDLSIGAILGMSAFIFASNTMNGRSPVVAVLLALAVASAMGAINGLITIWTKIPSFITTLGTAIIFRAAIQIYSGGFFLQTLERLAVYDFFNGKLDIINNLFELATFRGATLWAILLLFIFHYLLTFTPFGNHVFAVGGNPEVAKAQGVNVRRTKMICFILNGTLAGFAGILLFSHFNTVLVNTGAGIELMIIAGAVVGGTLLMGGYGSIFGGFVGVFLISMLRTGIILLGFPSKNFEAIVGITIIAVAIINRKLQKV